MNSSSRSIFFFVVSVAFFNVTRFKKMPIVFVSYAINSDDCVGSSHRLCAERLFLQREIDRAKRHGVRPESLRRYIKRKIGHIAVYRRTKDGTLATSCPCRYCREVLVEYDLRVTYIDHAGLLVERCRPDEIPDGVLTSAQKMGRHIG